MTLRDRLERLEHSSGTPCGVCGLRPGERGYIAVRGLVERDQAPDPSLPDICPSCGRATRAVIHVLSDG